jgi:hypothetical protein
MATFAFCNPQKVTTAEPSASAFTLSYNQTESIERVMSENLVVSMT